MSAQSIKDEYTTSRLLNKWADSFRLHCKKRLVVFPSPAGMSLTKLSLAGNNLIIPAPAGDGKTANIF